MQRLILLGASGNAHDVLDIVDAINADQPTWEVIGFLDDNWQLGSQFLGLDLLGPLKTAACLEDCQFINCIGSERNHRLRQELLNSTNLHASRFATLAHPMANVSSRSRIGRGVYVSFGCCVGGGAELGDHVSLAPGVIIGHDSTIGSWAVLAPGAVVSGFVSIGSASYLGARCVVKQRLSVGANSLVGMGAVVTHDVESGTVVAGVPARIQKPVLQKQEESSNTFSQY